MEIKSFVDSISAERVIGWAVDCDAPDAPSRSLWSSTGLNTAAAWPTPNDRACAGCSETGFRVGISFAIHSLPRSP